MAPGSTASSRRPRGANSLAATSRRSVARSGRGTTRTAPATRPRCAGSASTTGAGRAETIDSKPRGATRAEGGSRPRSSSRRAAPSRRTRQAYPAAAARSELPLDAGVGAHLPVARPHEEPGVGLAPRYEQPVAVGRPGDVREVAGPRQDRLLANPAPVDFDQHQLAGPFERVARERDLAAAR